MEIRLTLKDVLTKRHGVITATAKALECNPATVYKCLDNNGMIILDDGRIFRDTGKTYKGSL